MSLNCLVQGEEASTSPKGAWSSGNKEIFPRAKKRGSFLKFHSDRLATITTKGPTKLKPIFIMAGERIISRASSTGNDWTGASLHQLRISISLIKLRDTRVERHGQSEEKRWKRGDDRQKGVKEKNAFSIIAFAIVRDDSTPLQRCFKT